MSSRSPDATASSATPGALGPPARIARRLVARREGVGLLEWLARLALAPVVAIAAWGTWRHGAVEARAAWAFAGWLALLAVHWRGAVPRWRRYADPGTGLRALTKLTLSASVVVVPVGLAQGQWLVAGAFVVMALASAGLWLRWRWSFWAWCAYAAAGLGDWAVDAARVALTALDGGGAAQPTAWRPLPDGLPGALFSLAVLGAVIEWRRRTFGPGPAPEEAPAPGGTGSHAETTAGDGADAC